MPRETVVLDFRQGFDFGSITTRGAEADLVTLDGAAWLRIRTETGVARPSVTVPVPGEGFDLKDKEYLAIDVLNKGNLFCEMQCTIDTQGIAVFKNHVATKLGLWPGERETMLMSVSPAERFDEGDELKGMHGVPVAAAAHAPKVTRLEFFVLSTHGRHELLVGPVCAGGQVKTRKRNGFFPFVDELGQYMHWDWPGKTRDVEDLRASIAQEEEMLAGMPAPKDRNLYGGWTDGPQLKATGAFRVEKYKDKWWFVDPAGRLFWSHGVNCVNNEVETPITDREDYFSVLPAETEPLGKFYSPGHTARHNMYAGYEAYTKYDFGSANLMRKYGQNWQEAAVQMTLKRIAGWGLNTIGNWSNPAYYRNRNVPYTATVRFIAPMLAGGENLHAYLHDVFTPEFGATLAEALTGMTHECTDPWCLGFFINNELGWQHDTHVAEVTLASPAAQPAKRAFIDDLKARYEDITALNKSWGTDHASWDALLQCRQPPERERARPDLVAFSAKTARMYFRTMNDIFRKAAPGRLYLGPRLASYNDAVVAAAVKYCDVVAFNRYEYSVADLRLPEGMDKPIMVSEFHFGALDRGLPHWGQRLARSQDHRAKLYREFVRSALGNPQIVGAHWFQYRDQIVSGRFDGENFQTGLVDICDRPLTETVEAVREVGLELYAQDGGSRFMKLLPPVSQPQGSR